VPRRRSSIYELPLHLQKEGLDDLVLDLCGLNRPRPSENIWEKIVRRIKNPAHEVTIGVVGKYIELQDAYKSVYESVTHAGIANNCRVNIRRIDAEDLEKTGASRCFRARRHSRARRFSATVARRARSPRPALPAKKRSLLRPLPRPADRGDRICAPRAETEGRQQHGVDPQSRHPSST